MLSPRVRALLSQLLQADQQLQQACQSLVQARDALGAALYEEMQGSPPPAPHNPPAAAQPDLRVVAPPVAEAACAAPPPPRPTSEVPGVRTPAQVAERRAA